MFFAAAVSVGVLLTCCRFHVAVVEFALGYSGANKKAS